MKLIREDEEYLDYNDPNDEPITLEEEEFAEDLYDFLQSDK